MNKKAFMNEYIKGVIHRRRLAFLFQGWGFSVHFSLLRKKKHTILPNLHNNFVLYFAVNAII